MRTHHGLYYDSRIKLLLILLTSALAFAFVLERTCLFLG